MVLRLAGGFDRRLDDVLRGGEVRFACAEPNNRPACCLQRLRLGINGKGGGFGNCGYALGNAGGRHGRSVLRLQPEGWNVGFDEFYSMLFTGPSGLPVLNVTALQSMSGQCNGKGRKRAGSTNAKLLRRLVHRC
ncbi:hypothetical protein ARTHRO9AX_180653 [Arthrobacter sp. 9AX]|nr:hypothetical protein ARTHRO9AX_180653 [Arthrobacter sp. 9AX]